MLADRSWRRAGLVAVCILLGVAAGLVLDRVLERTPAAAVAFVTPVRRANSLLHCYAQQLAQFAVVASAFSQARFGDTNELRLHAAPLKSVILGTNSRYSAIEKASIALMLDLQGFVDGPVLACKLQRAEAYQWRRLRPALNTLLVNVIIAWQHEATPDELERIRVQQRQAWPAFARTMQDGATEFGVGGPDETCP